MSSKILVSTSQPGRPNPVEWAPAITQGLHLNDRQHRRSGRKAARMLLLTAAAFLLWSPGLRSLAQQVPDRQLVQPPRSQTVRRLALVIGNGSYTNAPTLKNPANDARDMAATLKLLGFEVLSGVNVSQREMKRLIREFGQQLKSGGNGLFYYAGHGVQTGGNNYIIPVDADISSEADVENWGVDISLVLNYMDEAQNGLNIVILDACRNNPFRRSFRSASDGLAQVDAPTGTLIAYATAPGRVAADGEGSNGLYTSELLKAMRVPGVTATEMFMHVRAEVMKRTANKQVPWEASSLVGLFYFIAPASNGKATMPRETKFDSAAFELSYWETIKHSTQSEDFKAYLEKYPSGQFASLAKNRISTLERSAKPAEPKIRANNRTATELAFWNSIKDSANPDDFRLYLKRYPEGEFADLARTRAGSLAAATVTAKPRPFLGFRIVIRYRNKEGVNQLALATKVAERLRESGADVSIEQFNWKDYAGKLRFWDASDAETAGKIAQSIGDLVTLKPEKGEGQGNKSEFTLWLQ